MYGTADRGRAIEDGLIIASAYQDPSKQGAGSVDTALAIVKGEKPAQRNLLPVEAVTKANLAKFKK